MDATTWSIWSAIATVIAAMLSLIAVGISIYAVRVQRSQTAFVTGVELLDRLNERFDSNETLVRRKAAASGLLHGRPEDAEDVLNFFELMGLLLERGALDREMVWHCHSHWILHYWAALAEYVAECRKRDPHVWTQTESLAKEMLKLERERRRQPAFGVSTEDLGRFLAMEEGSNDDEIAGPTSGSRET